MNETRPQRIQLSRKRGFNLQAASLALNGLPAVNVARPSIWGNPFIHPDRAEAVAAFRRYCGGGTQAFSMGPGGLQFAKRIHQCALHWAWPDYLRDHIHELRGKNLACWCGEGPCHADVLLALCEEATSPALLDERTER